LGKNIYDFPNRVAMYESQHVLGARMLLYKCKGNIFNISEFGAMFIEFSCTAFTITRFAKRQPELPGAQLLTRQSFKKKYCIYLSISCS
jgi:hypothetical protein